MRSMGQSVYANPSVGKTTEVPLMLAQIWRAMLVAIILKLTQHTNGTVYWIYSEVAWLLLHETYSSGIQTP